MDGNDSFVLYAGLTYVQTSQTDLECGGLVLR